MKFKIKNSEFKINKTGFRIDDLIKAILENRGIKTKKEAEEFLNPKLIFTVKSVGIDDGNVKKAIRRIQSAIKNKEQVVVYGDYDVDGICGTAILWETLNKLGAEVTPYIPHRIDQGYGLSVAGIKNLESSIKNVKLIITVDNGIVANKAVEFAKKKGIDVIITDHHVPSEKLPNALAIVHTTRLCGTGVVYMFANSLWQIADGKKSISHNAYATSHLELVALATIADLVPLKGANRVFLKFGLEELRKTKRVGLLELFKEAALDKNSIGVYEIGHIIAPRLNAMGRLQYAMDSLRLICTNNQKRAEDLARLLGNTNRERQSLTLQTVLHAVEKVSTSLTLREEDKTPIAMKKLLFIAHKSYEQGVIGLAAGKLVEQYYKPSIVVSIGKKFSKGSARSVSGFNIIEFIRAHSSFLVDAGGHPMAAGFTVETKRLKELQFVLEKKAEELLTDDHLRRTIFIDLELPLSLVNQAIYDALKKMAPFGMGNPEPTFISRNVVVEDIRLVGTEGKHLKLKLKVKSPALPAGRQESKIIDGIGFGMGDRIKDIKIGDKIDVVYTIDENEWSGEKRLQLRTKDLSVSTW